jgi:hypothetical protein
MKKKKGGGRGEWGRRQEEGIWDVPRKSLCSSLQQLLS